MQSQICGAFHGMWSGHGEFVQSVWSVPHKLCGVVPHVLND